ncbi:AraC family transcriptional regulator [Pseudomonas sp. H9]|nr:AraC family transcriptional regulator [Pseudomonas sp. H9]
MIRSSEDHPDPDLHVNIPCADAYSVVIQLKDFNAHRLWQGRELTYVGGHACQSTSIVYLGDEIRCQHRAAYDNLKFILPRSTIQSLFYEAGGSTTEGLERVRSQVDPVVYHLSLALLPALTTPSETNELFIDQVMLALLTHLDKRYGNAILTNEKTRGLATWQLRRAKELIANHVTEGLSVELLAKECSLSRSYFTRAFKQSTGQSPHEWLTKIRVDKAKALMTDSALNLSEIGLDCGFADQSHFSRVFLKQVGMAPASWRRAQRQVFDGESTYVQN